MPSPAPSIIAAFHQFRKTFLALNIQIPEAIILPREAGQKFLDELRMQTTPGSLQERALQSQPNILMTKEGTFHQIELLGINVRWPAILHVMPRGNNVWI